MIQTKQMKTLILGDVHGRSCWKDIIEKENPDRVIFLGDFVTTHELYTADDQLKQLNEILEYKRSHPDTIILRGNHDLDGLCYHWASCYPQPDRKVRQVMDHTKPLGQEFLRLSQWIHVETIGGKPYIFAHAGVTMNWLAEVLKLDISDIPAALEQINAMEPTKNFGFTGGRWDNYGTDPQQSCTWVRPDTLAEYAIPGYNYVVGHTGTYAGCISQPVQETYEDEVDGGVHECLRDTDCEIWKCDALQQKAYLIIEDDKFIPKTL